MKNIFNIRREPLLTLVSIGLGLGLFLTGLSWVSPTFAKGLFSNAAWFWALILVGTLLMLTGARQAEEQRYPTVSKPALLLAVVAATALVYLFPELFAPGCGALRVPRAFAACPAACQITTCSDWAAPGERGCNAKPPDEGCCFAYETTCDPDCNDPDPTPVPVYLPPTITKTVTCAVRGIGKWCKSGAALEMSAADPQDFPTKIKGDIAGVAFACSGPTCSRALPAGSGSIQVRAYTPISKLSSAVKNASFAFDPTPPSAALAIAGTAGANGWYTAASVSTSGVDDTSGLASAQVAVDGGAWQASATLADGTHSVVGYASDNAGNETVTPAQVVKVDATAPSLSASVTSGKLAGSWYISDVVVKASASDLTSGMALIQTRLDGGTWSPGDHVLVTSDGAHSLDISATDYAGNVASYSMVIRKDATPPALSIPTAPDGLGGWYVTLPTLSLAASDAISGLASAAFSNGKTTYAIPSQGVSTVSAQATDYAGNTTSAAASVSVDTVPPTLTISSPVADGLNGWYVTSPTLSLTASDATSGLASALFSDGQASKTINTDGVHTLSALAADKAGNLAPGTITVKRDATPPSLNIPLAPDGLDGWYVTLPILSLAASDATSGLASALFSNGKTTTTIPGDGVYNLSASAADNAGNTTSADATIRVDTTPPALSIPSAPGGQNGWYVTTPTLSLMASDAASGLASAVFSNGNTTMLINSDGVYALSASAADKAGNTTSALKTVQVDTAPPELSFSIPYVPDGQNGWYVTAPTLSLMASDATSGLAGAAFENGDASFPTADGAQVISATAIDNAGNTAVISQTLKVDTTPPMLTPSITATGANPLTGTGGWYNTPVILSLDALDTTSGVGQTEYRLDGGIWHSGSELTVSSEGEHTLEMRVSDNAGNTTTASRSFKLDTTKPVSAFSRPREGTQIWAADTVSFAGASTDALSGLAATEISLDGGAAWLALPSSGGSWSYAWDTLRVPDGTYTILVQADDKAGNRENTARVQVVVGNKPPKVEIQPSWWLWESGVIEVQQRQIPLRDVTVRISCMPYHPDVVLSFSAGNVPANLKWDRLCGNGTYAAESGNYAVTLTACDILNHCSEDSGVIKVPFIAPPVPTWTPTMAPPTAPSATGEPHRPTPTATRPVIALPLEPPAEVPAKQPSPALWLWLPAALLGLLLAFGLSSLLDPRPAALRRLRATWQQVSFQAQEDPDPS